MDIKLVDTDDNMEVEMMKGEIDLLRNEMNKLRLELHMSRLQSQDDKNLRPRSTLAAGNKIFPDLDSSSVLQNENVSDNELHKSKL